jgi:hypothetical protein
MRCIDDCGYKQKPDNLEILTRHIEECLAYGACQRLTKDPSVVWRDGEFAVVEEPSKSDTSFPITLIKKEAVELTEDMIKTLEELNRAKARGLDTSMVTTTNGKKPTTNVIKANLEGGI